MLTAIEMGMKNHELVPAQLIQSIAKQKRANTFKIINNLLKHKLILHKNTKCDGYALNYSGYDYLALRVFMKRGHISKLGSKFGVGKESDIYLWETPEGENIIIKLERLGRTSFRAVKNKRDYLKHRTSFSWFYISRLAAKKEYAFMKALYERGFPTPKPIDYNRHAILMSRVDAYPMTHINEMINPKEVYVKLMKLIIKLAENGLIHGDFNEFNLMIDDKETITMIDFPQMISIDHRSAKFYFDRDVAWLQTYFERKHNLIFEDKPQLDVDVERNEDLIDVEKEDISAGVELIEITDEQKGEETKSQNSHEGEDEDDEEIGKGENKEGEEIEKDEAEGEGENNKEEAGIYLIFHLSL